MQTVFDELLEELIQNALAQGVTITEVWASLQAAMDDLPRHLDLQRLDADA